ncbi:MAG: hypothetical protein DMF41_01145 [Verrucomicrobia bacterium]|nr:MAG: hypothetical protein DMF41_01145 [Verrucomicrobiota bacterium]
MNRWGRVNSWVDRARQRSNTLTPTRESRSDVNAFTVRLNFHGDLNFFLGSRTRSGRIERILAEKVSVKDVIESCGVPHPEVDLILVNGRAVGFDYGLEHIAEVEVFSVHALPPHFEENRWLLMHSVVRHGYCPRSQNADAQTIEVIRRFELFGAIAPFTRCLRCNALLEKVAKGDVMQKLEPLTKVYYEKFGRCTGCGQIYWAGSHFSKLQKRLEAIRARCS